MENRIVPDGKGNYMWTGVIDRQFEATTFKLVFGVCGGIGLFFIIMSLVLGGDMIGVTLLSCAAAMAVAGVVCWLFAKNAGKRTQRYIMNEDSVIFCQPRRNVPFTFRSVRRVVICPSRHMIYIHQSIGGSPVFVPPEDFTFVRDYILARIPGSARVDYE